MSVPVAPRLPAAPDVAILGAGIVGCSLAAFLAEAGLSVRVYEPTAVAAGASGRNSGVVQHPLDPILASLYHATLTEYGSLREEVPSFAEALAPEPAGLMYVGRDGVASERIAAAWRTAWPATDPTVLSGPALRRLEPSLADDLVACRLEMGHPVAPAAATEAFATLARRRGAEFVLGGDVRLGRTCDRSVGVERDASVDAAGRVVIAAGPWTPRIVDPSGAWRPIRPSWGVVAGLALGEAAPRHGLEATDIEIEPAVAGAPGSAELAEDGRASPVTDELVDFSLARGDRSSGLGSTFLPDEPDAEAWLPALRRVGARYVPAVADAPLIGLRRCARPVSLDGRPLIGRAPWADNVWVVAGHGPWGISTGPASSRLLVEALLAGTEASIDPAFSLTRFGLPPG